MKIGYCVPVTPSMASYRLRVAIPAEIVRRHEVLLVEADGTRLARTGSRRGAGVFVADRLIDVSGFTAVVRLDSLQGVPRLIPNLSAALVVLLSVALGVVILLLVHDVRRRSAAEQALAEALAQNIGGKESTPFLLARVCDITGGDSLAANIQLVLNNARLASAVGIELAGMGGRA